MRRGLIFLVLFNLTVGTSSSEAQTMIVSQRGELLYSTHCIACHNSQIHWRDKILAKDYQSLIAQVDRWQKLANLGWNNEDISSVVRYLNTLHYHYSE
jgi:mono/diheme cytochrome c family protein